MIRFFGTLLAVSLLIAAPLASADANPGKGKGKAKQEQKVKQAEAKVETAVEAQPGPAANEDMIKDQVEQVEQVEQVDQVEGAARGKGAAKSAEMKAHRDQSKAAKTEYKEAVEGGADRVKGKKPWWKAWGE